MAGPLDYVLTGIGSPERQLLRGAVCDYLRTTGWGPELLGTTVTRTVLHGPASRAGLP